jgi:mRNA-degrading endonuclease RelE of RelBE toxin-antitoxin system
MKYRLLVDWEVIEFLETLPRKDQKLLRDRFVAMQDYPQKFSDYAEFDSVRRRVDIHVCGKYAVKFWEDHADKHLKILDARFADKSPQ